MLDFVRCTRSIYWHDHFLTFQFCLIVFSKCEAKLQCLGQTPGHGVVLLTSFLNATAWDSPGTVPCARRPCLYMPVSLASVLASRNELEIFPARHYSGIRGAEDILPLSCYLDSPVKLSGL